MSEEVSIWLSDAEKTAFTGGTLSKSLYGFPLDIYLSGELGAGKTTFLQGFARALGITEPITSPTYALEQRYETAKGMSFIHIDLYRLRAKQAKELLSTTDNHNGIRVIEWPERAERSTAEHPTIFIDLAEEKSGRSLTCMFEDMPLPSKDDIYQWRKDVLLPKHIVAHCDAVGAFAEKLARLLMKSGTIARPQALLRAGQVHDLLRFIDFRPGAAPPGMMETTEETKRHTDWKRRYKDLHHEAACTEFLKEHGYDGLAAIVLTHGFSRSKERETIEQELLFYADKRAKMDVIVSLDERFRDFRKRYGASKESDQAEIWFRECKDLEEKLFPEGAPF